MNRLTIMDCPVIFNGMNDNTFPVQRLLEWFSKKKRKLPWRESRDMYLVWVSEVMLQQTQVATVVPYFERFIERFPTVYDLAASTEQAVLKVWEGMGYYSRARNLHQATQVVVDKYSGNIPADVKNFKSLPGVGPYISAAVLSISRGIPIPVVDGNVLRVFTRFMGIRSDIRKSSTRKKINDVLVKIIPHDKPGDFNQALMELGAMVCKPGEPRCPDCPIKGYCYAFIRGEMSRFPYKSPFPKVPEYRVSVGVIVKKNRFYVQKRPSRGHLGGLWEFPGGKGKEEETPEETLLRECGEELKG